MKTLFEVNHLEVAYGETKIVKDVSLSIAEGTLCALLGLNGCGKTTMMRGICGLIPMKGSVHVNGLDVGKMKEKEKAHYLSLIPQIASDIQGKTVLDVVLMGVNPYLHFLESPGKRHVEQARNALKQLNIEGFAEKEFSKLSQGQKQLVILARTLVQNTPVMLMDEPDSALDFRNRHMVLEQIRDVIKQEGKAGLITLHDPNFAMAYCDRLVLLKNGDLVENVDMNNTPRDVLESQLATIYGEISLIPFGSRYLMGRQIS